MDEAEVERIAASVVKKLQEPLFIQGLARAVAAELDLRGFRYRKEIAKLGERVDNMY
ncbi:MAG: hypothetical protein KGJ66_12770 [Alphaproteobacteria bacterium]|nr:hypothetical protein [Alphaproteobacteria bacterium]